MCARVLSEAATCLAVLQRVLRTCLTSSWSAFAILGAEGFQFLVDLPAEGDC